MTTKSKIINYVPDSLFFGSILGIYLINRSLPFLEIIPAPFNYTGWILVVGGCFLVVRSMAILKAKHASTDVVRTSEVLITDGLYSYSRNPLYLAELMVIVGAAVVCGSLGVWIWPILYATVLSLYIIPFEERNLQKKFDRSYEEYKREVRRWV